jgi:hypothetical protein
MSEEESRQEEIHKEEPKKENEYVTKLNILYSNLEAAQLHKDKGGSFTMLDCKNIAKAKKTLVDFFNDEENDSKTTKEELDAFAVLVKGCEMQQATGVFSMDGSIYLLNILENIEDILKKNMDPALKLKEMKKKYKRGK